MARRGKRSHRGHARHTTALATRPSVVVVRSGGRRRSHRGPSRVAVSRRGRARAVGGHALHATGLGVGGALLGYLQGGGHLDFVPAIMGSKTLGMGLLGYAATRMTRNKYLREAGAAAVAVAGFEFGREHGASKPAVHGHGGAGPWAGV